MAQVMKTSNGLEKYRRRYLILTILPWLIIAFLTIIILNSGSIFDYLDGFAIMAIVIYGCYRMAKHYKNEFTKINIGLRGEKQTLKLLKNHLPDNYYIFNDFTVKFDGKTSQLDNVVVSPNGVFVIEVKNYHGFVMGYSQDQDWRHIKTSSNGNTYESTIYNPMKQVATHTYRLSHFLDENGIDTWVQSAVYFANPNVEVDIEFSDDNRIGFYTSVHVSNMISRLSNPAENPLTEEEIGTILSLLEAGSEEPEVEVEYTKLDRYINRSKGMFRSVKEFLRKSK